MSNVNVDVDLSRAMFVLLEVRLFSGAVTHLCRRDAETKVFVIRYLRVDANPAIFHGDGAGILVPPTFNCWLMNNLCVRFSSTPTALSPLVAPQDAKEPKTGVTRRQRPHKFDGNHESNLRE